MSIPVVLLAGGLGTRLREETEVKPKPMVEVGEFPILWHIMKSYAHYGFNEFVICLGYKGNYIKNYFLNYRQQQGSLTVDMASGAVTMHHEPAESNWKIHLLETGADTMTGGRVRRAMQFLGRRRVMLTYGDGVSDIDINGLLAFHERQGRQATISAVRPPARFGGLSIVEGRVEEFVEKPQIGEGWINGGFMVLEPSVVDLIADDTTILERQPLEALANSGELAAYQHQGFWQCMDTVRDLSFLRELWAGPNPPWKSWD